jgi:hypothetical protein
MRIVGAGGNLMKKITVKVNTDHLRTLSRAKKPILAVAELIWNALDADAGNVSVAIEENSLGGLECIRVIDDGLGLPYNDAIMYFSNLGGSWKRSRHKSKQQGRLLHGRLGKGRFRAFSLGQSVTWRTKYGDNGTVKQYNITGKLDDPKHFILSDPQDSDVSTGTEVVVENILKNFTSLRGDGALLEIASHFALYLRQYPDIKIKYDGQMVTTDQLEAGVADFDLENVYRPDGSPIQANLTIIEWKQQTERSICLCDSGGFSLIEIPAGIHARGYNFTAYLKSDYIREMEEEGVLVLEVLYPGIKTLVDASREILRNYFRKREADEASEIVRKWKEERVYPFDNEPKTAVEKAERQVFDVCALNIHSYLPDFEEASHKSKHLAFQLLRNALETNPSAIQTILTKVLDLPEKKQREFANLLRHTTLDAIITASKTVADRLTFLRGLDLLLFNPESKKQLLERSQLHRILAENTWIFGEQFNLTLDDQSLTELLKKHRKKLGDEVVIVDEVRREDGTKGIIDLVVGRRIPTARGQNREHLVIELKRPKDKLNDQSLTQIRSYAFAVASDERFMDTETKWTFWLVSNDMNDSVRRQVNQRKLQPGCAHDDSEGNFQIWVKTWGQIIAECDGRLQFFQEQLQIRADRDDVLNHLRNEYRKYLPDAFQKAEVETVGRNGTGEKTKNTEA